MRATSPAIRTAKPAAASEIRAGTVERMAGAHRLADLHDSVGGEVVQRQTEAEIKKLSADEQKKLAQDLDNPLGGHGLARHGPNVPDDALKDRLTTGYIHGKFSPAPAISTRWTNYQLYLICRIRATDTIKAAHQHTWAKLGPLIALHKTAYDAWNAAVGAAKGPLMPAMVAAWTAVTTEAAKYTAVTSPYFLPIAVNGPPNYRIMTRAAYNLVVRQHDLDSLGEGFKGDRAHQIDNPNGVIDPATGAVRRETIYQKWIALPYGIHHSATTFEVGDAGVELTGALDPGTWTIPRHYPDNREEAWY